MAERGATMAADVCLPGVAEQKVEIFCLLGFVEDRRQMCFSRGNPSCFFLHMRVLRERKATKEGRGAKRRRQQRKEEEQEREQQQQTPHSWSVFSLFLQFINQLFQLTRNPKVSSMTLSTTGVLFFLSVPVLPLLKELGVRYPNRRFVGLSAHLPAKYARSSQVQVAYLGGRLLYLQTSQY